MRAALLLTAALIAAPAAFAQSNNQYESGDVSAITEIKVGAAYDAAATAVASGNVVATEIDGSSASIANTQHMDGDTAASTDALVLDAEGNTAAASAALGNGATAVLRNSSAEMETTQLAHGDSTAETTFNGGYAANASTSASASGNVAAVSADYSGLRLLSDQESTGAVAATIEANHDIVAGAVVSAALASANNMSVAGETSTILTDMRQSANGDGVAARVDLYAGYASDASGNATANANSATIANQWGYVNARIEQLAATSVSADSFVTLGGEFTGIGSSGAYGVGNQAIVSNVGSDTVVDTLQDNAGDISATAALSGEGGQASLASAAAYGNTVTGYVCSQCDANVPGLEASNNQSNAGNVSATARLITPRTSNAAAGATAIGNAATYSARGP